MLVGVSEILERAHTAAAVKVFCRFYIASTSLSHLYGDLL